MKPEDKIFIAGHQGMVGSAIERALRDSGYNNLLVRTSRELDLRNQKEVERFFQTERPDYVFLAAAKVGGIMANMTYPAEFLYDNLMIAGNVIQAAYQSEVSRLMFLGSSCMYPRNCRQPMKEEELMQGSLEPTNESYALAKIAGLKLCEMYNRQYGTHYLSVIPCNLYGPGDNFHAVRSHVVPALVRKFHEAKMAGEPEVEVWGSGRARREFMYVDDLADACMYFMQRDCEVDYINIGTGYDVTISQLAECVCEAVGYQGQIRYDHSKPDGMPQKLVDIERQKDMGWVGSTSLKDGICRTYQWYLEYIAGIAK